MPKRMVVSPADDLPAIELYPYVMKLSRLRNSFRARPPVSPAGQPGNGVARLFRLPGPGGWRGQASRPEHGAPFIFRHEIVKTKSTRAEDLCLPPRLAGRILQVNLDRKK
jgi:hypothetical protein